MSDGLEPNDAETSLPTPPAGPSGNSQEEQHEPSSEQVAPAQTAEGGGEPPSAPAEEPDLEPEPLTAHAQAQAQGYWGTPA